MMKLRISKSTRFVLVGAACMAFCTATASADIHVFWKTHTCPNFGGTKPAIAWELGVMQAPIGDPDVTFANGVGGAYCVISPSGNPEGPYNNLSVLPTNRPKLVDVQNANITRRGVNERQLYTCVICQYPDKVTPAIPAISLLGTIILMAGLLTAGAYRIGKKQREAVA